MTEAFHARNRLNRASVARFMLSISMIALSTGTGSALAQTVAPPAAGTAPAESNSGIAEIVVTAQKREQRLQDVPVAVTALNSAALQTNRVTTINDLTGLAPGLVARQNAGAVGSPSLALRGVYATAAAASQDREVSLYLDGVYVGGNRGSVFDLPDVERIEVLRGPQGTLFGRNATAGAISVITADPKGVFGARQEVTVGNYRQLRTSTTVESPNVGPFSAYITYVHDQRRGDIRNDGAGSTFDFTSPFTNVGVRHSPTWLGSRNFNNVFAAVKFAPSANFKMVYKFDYSDGDYTPEGTAINAVNSSSFIGGLLSQIIALQPAGGGAYGKTSFDPQNKRPGTVDNAWDQYGFSKSIGHNLTTQWDISDHLSLKDILAFRYANAWGPTTLAGLSGLEYTSGVKTLFTMPQAFLGGASYAQVLNANGNQPVGSYFAAYDGNSYGWEHQWSNETQLNYKSRLLTVTAGAIYYHSYEKDSGLPGMQQDFAFTPVPTLLPLGSLQNSSSKTNSLAGYTQAEIHVTPQLELVAGGRVTRDRKIAGADLGGIFTGSRSDGILVGVDSTNQPFNKTKPTFSVGANYKPSRDILVYGKYSTAFLSGGATGPLTFAPETVKSVEAGFKSEFFDHRLRMNIAAYVANYQHSQSAQSGSVIQDPDHPGQTLAEYGIVVVDNGPLHAKGFEAEITAAPVTGLTISGSVGYVDATLPDPNPLAANGQPYDPTGVAPWTGSTYAQYVTQPLFGDATMMFRLDANYQGRYRNIPNPNIASVNPVLAPYAFAQARWILNARIAVHDLQIGPTTGEIGLWSRNLTNNRDSSTGILFGDFLFASTYQPARTIGVDFILKI